MATVKVSHCFSLLLRCWNQLEFFPSSGKWRGHNKCSEAFSCPRGLLEGKQVLSTCYAPCALKYYYTFCFICKILRLFKWLKISLSVKFSLSIVWHRPYKGMEYYSRQYKKILAVHSSHPYCLLSVSVDLPVVDMNWKWSHKSHIPLSLSSLSLTVSTACPCCVAHISVSSLFNSSVAFHHAFTHSYGCILLSLWLATLNNNSDTSFMYNFFYGCLFSIG